MSRIEEENRPWGMGAKAFFGAIALVMVPPFVMLAVAPMVLMLLPVAFVAIPFVLAAFAGEARDVQPVPRRVRAFSHAHS